MRCGMGPGRDFTGESSVSTWGQGEPEEQEQPDKTAERARVVCGVHVLS
jgi:hypothetical protein